MYVHIEIVSIFTPSLSYYMLYNIHRKFLDTCMNKCKSEVKIYACYNIILWYLSKFDKIYNQRYNLS